MFPPLPSSSGPLQTTTPPSITAPILALCKSIVRGGTPTYLDVRVEPYAEMNECFAAVAKKIELDGGSIQHGWTIWKFGEWMAEAEFHAVWRSPAGELVDISPKLDCEDKIVFLADPKRTYQGAPLDNFRHPLVKNQVVDDYITVARKQFNLLFAGKSRMVTLDPATMMPIAEGQLVVKSMLDQGLTGEDPCACQSGKRYKNCHSKFIKAIRV